MPSQIAFDPDFIWMGETQREALASLSYGIFENKGFLLITGEIGTGKTTLINNLVRNLGEEVIIARVPDPGMDNFDFANFISHAIKIEKEFKSKSKFLIHFSKFLNDACADNKMVLLIIDEGQRLKDLLQKILLPNTEKPEKKLPNIFLLGQQKPNQTQNLDTCRPRRRQTSINHSLQPLNAHKTGGAIRHRLRVAGAEYDIYSSGPILAVHAISDGAPSITCEKYSATRAVNESPKITPEIVESGDLLTGLNRTEMPKTPETFRASDPMTARKIPLSAWLKGVSLGIFVAASLSTAFIYHTRSHRGISHDVGDNATKATNNFPVPDATQSSRVRETSTDSQAYGRNQFSPGKPSGEDDAEKQATSQSYNRESPAVLVEHYEPASPASGASATSSASPHAGPPSQTESKVAKSIETERILIQQVSIMQEQHKKEEKPQSALPWDQIRTTSPQTSDPEKYEEVETVHNRTEGAKPAVATDFLSSGRDASLDTVEAMRKMIPEASVSATAEGDHHQMKPPKAESKDILEAVSQILENPEKSEKNSEAANQDSRHTRAAVNDVNILPSTDQNPPGLKAHAPDLYTNEPSLEKNGVAEPSGNDKDATQIIDYILIKRSK